MEQDKLCCLVVPACVDRQVECSRNEVRSGRLTSVVHVSWQVRRRDLAYSRSYDYDQHGVDCVDDGVSERK